MLLAVNFCTSEVCAWDQDKRQANLKTVQGILLKFFAEYDLPLVLWSDNGGRFKNVIQIALRDQLGVLPRHIPPCRPQANGLEERFNGIVDAAHGGDKSKLLPAVVAINGMPSRKYGASPEALWRVLRPLTSRWRNAGLQTLVFGSRKEITETEWLQFLDGDAKHALSQDAVRNAVAAVQEKVEPILEATECQQRRTEMSARLGYGKNRAAATEMPLLTGDRVLCKTSQYASKTGAVKFEMGSSGGALELRGMAVNKSLVELKEQQSGKVVFRHCILEADAPRCAAR